MEEFELKAEYITLGQFLKVQNYVSSGAEVKIQIEKLAVLVNGQSEFRRGKKLRAGDIVSLNEQKFLIKPWKLEI